MPKFLRRRRPMSLLACWMIATTTGLSALALTGCEDDTPPPSTPPAATYKGPAYLNGTVGSLTSLRGYEPLYVSGYGLVVGLEGTGSTSTPTYIRSWMTTRMRAGGFGTEKYQYQNMSPERILSSGTASVVVIEGLIPPGARRGARFDTLITALPGTQTTSLRNGELYTFDLSIDGANPRLLFTRPLAKAGGSIYLDPIDAPSKNGEARILDERMGIVLSGGIATEDRKLELLLNNPSWGRSVMIAQAINTRFPPALMREDMFYAKAFNDQIINIKVPEAYTLHPDRFLDLISYLYVQVAPNGEGEVAQQMAKILAKDPTQERAVKMVWIGLGKLAVPIIQQYYDSPQRHMKLAALEAGVRLGDSGALGDADQKTRIMGLTTAEDPKDRILAARLLLPKSDLFRVQVALKKLLDDPNTEVRIAAYETLAEAGDPIIQSQIIGDPDFPKYILDMVPSSRSMVLVIQKDYPRVVIFNPMLGFKENTVAKVGDNQLMIRSKGRGEVATVFYQAPGEVEPQTIQIAPAVGNLVYAMGQRPNSTNTDPGFGMTYSQVVGFLKDLHTKGFIESEFQVRENILSEIVRAARKTNPFEPRPETEEPGADTQPSSTQPGTQPSTQPTTRPANTARPRRASPEEVDAIPQPSQEKQGIMSNTPSTKDISPADAWNQTDPSQKK
jgi:flagellar basal body P-ring protein FlgI